MNLDFCPNKRSKEFQEMASVLGGEDKAYFFWMRNKGNPLDKAPNGADSKLFKSLLDYFKGDRAEALKAKAKVYSNDFLNWFGDWIGFDAVWDDKGYRVDDVSQFIDDNGEPVIMFHRSDDDIKIFNKKFNKHVGFWFSKNPNYYKGAGSKGERKYAIPVFLSSKNPNRIEHEIFLSAVDGSEEPLPDRYDGWITLNISRPESYEDTYSEEIVFGMVNNPNQIKSATSNKQDIITGESGFSTEDNNIYHHIDKNQVLRRVKDYIQDYIDNKFGKGHSYKEVQAKVKDLESQFNVVGIAVTSDKKLDFSQLHFEGDSFQKDKKISRIQGEDVFTSIKMLVDNISKLFPKLNIKVVEDSSIIQGNAYYDASTNTIHYSPIRSGNKKSVDTRNIVEECIHPLIACIAATDKELFNILLKEASKDEAVVSYVEVAYSGKSQSIRDQEVVSQVIAKMYADNTYQKRLSVSEFQRKEFSRRIKSIVNAIAEWISKLKKLIVGDKLIVGNKDFSTVISSLQSVVDLLNTPQVEFEEVDNSYMLDNMWHINSENVEQDIESRRQDYVNNVVSTWKEQSKLEGEELQNAILKVKDDARKQFDLDEIASLRNNKELSDKDKHIALSLLYRDLEIVTGLQHTESIQKNLDKETFETIKEGTKTRLRSHLNRTTKQTRLINDLKDQLAQMENVNPEDIDEMFKQIEQFLINAQQEILKTRRFIDEQLVGKDISTWDPQQINYIRYDLLGYYDGILSQLYKLFTNDSKVGELNKLRAQKALELASLSDEEKQNLSKEDQEAMYAQDLFDLTTSLQRVVDSMQQDYQDKVAIPYAKKVLTDFVYESDAVKDKDTFIRNMIRWIEQDTAYGDLAVGEIALGMASRSRSSVINIVEKMMSDIEFEKNREILKEGNELIRLYNKVRPAGSQVDFRNFQKLFMEMDGEDGTSGKFTGYFVRDRNYGKFYKDKDAFETTLRDKYAKKGLKWRYNEYNDSYDLIFPEEDHTANNSVYNQYYDELDEWLDKHCERRYILDYYKKKRRFLSPAALQAQQLIQHQIDILSQKGMTEDGFVDGSKLTPTERQRLADLRKEKRELACPYIFSSLSDGTVTLKEKQGEDAEIAKQIANWNRYIAEHVKYKQNDEKFNAALSKFEKDSPEYKQFLADNRIQVINPEFWNYVLRNAPKQKQEYKELAERHRAIVEHIKRRRGFAQPNLDLLGIGINTDTSAWEELQRLEQQMEELRVRSEEEQDTQEYISSFLVPSTKEADKNFLDWLGERWNYEMEADSSAAEKFRQLFMYTDYKGRQRYLKVFSVTRPASFSIKKENGESIPTTIYQYSSQFSELDESSDFVNKNYKKEIKFSMQPKVRKPGTKRVQGKIDYTNDNYQKILENEGYKQLYDKLINIMEKANNMIPSKAIEHRFLLPQITGRGLSILGRSRSSADLFASLNYGLQDWTGLKFGKDGKPEFDESLMQQDTDVSTNWDLPRRPDGTIVNNIPVRFVKRLEDPSIISSDVLGSVLLYYDMALNYKLKSEKLPAFELIQEAINPNTKSKQSDKNKLPKQYQKMKQLMDYRIYGKESKLGGDETKTYSKFQKSTMQISKKFRSLASMSMLALNFTTIEVGYLDALLGSIADAVGGKYFTTEDLRKGYWQAFKSLFNIIPNLGNPVVNDWMVAAMQYNQLSKSNSEIFGRTDQSRWSRILSELRMGGYTMADYLINTMILGATYNHYRLVDMPDGKSKKFMSKTDTVDIFTKHGYSENEAINKWESAKTTLRQAYYQEDGLLKIKDDFKQYINKKLENQIAGRLRDRTAVYNGIIPQTEKAAIQQNVFGSFLTLMRNFYVNTYWERARAGYDYATEEEIESNKFNMYTSDSAGSVNFETGEFGNGLWFSALKGFYKYIQNVKALVTRKDLRQLTDDQKYAVKRILTEVAIIGACAFLMTWSIAFARTNDYDEDKDPMWTVNIFDPEGEDRGILEFNGKNAGDKMLNWTRWKLALLATRTFTERSTFYWPGTVTELISSPSTAKSYLDDLGYSLELFMDLFEINGHDRNEMVRSGGYKGMTRGTRDIMKITGATGIDNVIRNWHTSGIKSTLNWYQGVSPNNFLIPNKSTWEKEQGIKSSSSGSKKSNIVY